MCEKKFVKAVNCKLFGLCLVMFLLAGSRVVSAQQTISATPSVMIIDLATDPSEAAIIYKNNTDHEVSLALSAQDFTELQDGWKVDFLAPKDAKNYQYSLSSWISFATQDIFLHPHEERSIKLFIDQARLAPGGHYASILAEFKQQQPKQQITIKGILASLLFVRTNTGKEKEEAKVTTFQADHSLFMIPSNFSFRFQNTGNVQLVPYGRLDILNNQGESIAYGIVNDGSFIVLPESIRRFDVPLIGKPAFMLPGIYTARLSIQYGKSKKQIITTTKFATQGTINVIAIGLGLIVLFVSWYILRKIVL